MIYMSFGDHRSLNSNIPFSLKQDYGRVGGVDAGPVLCHPYLLVLCNSLFLLQNKITLCVQMHAYMRGGTVPKDQVHTDKPRLASGSFCLHS